MILINCQEMDLIEVCIFPLLLVLFSSNEVLHTLIASCILSGVKPITVQITFIFIDFRVCDFAFAFKTQNAPCVSRFKRVLFSDRFQFAF